MTAQAPLPIAPSGDAIGVSAAADLVIDADGGRVFIYGALAFAWDAGDEVSQRVAAVQLVRTGAATQVQVAAAFGVDSSTVYRWTRQLSAGGAAGLAAGRTGPRGPSKLSQPVVDEIVALRGRGYAIRDIAELVGVSVGSVAGVASGAGDTTGTDETAGTRTNSVTAGDHDHDDTAGPGNETDADASGHDSTDTGGDADDGQDVLPLLSAPADRAGERALARFGLLDEAAPVFTPAGRVPLAGMLLAVPALISGGLLESARQVYGKLPDGFYGLDTMLVEAVFRTLAGQPRAEGTTRINPADLGRVLGMDRAPEVKTIRRKLGQLAGRQQASELLEAQARRHLARHADTAAVVYVDGHVRTYHGTRKIQKTHTPRLRFPAPATVETWIVDAAGQPVWVVMAEAGSSLASELSRLIPDIRDLVGDDRRILVGFDRGGWSPGLFADMIDSGFDVLTWRKHPAPDLESRTFHPHETTDATGAPAQLMAADQCVRLTTDERTGATVGLRQVSILDTDGHQAHILTSRHDLDPIRIVELMAARWRVENYFRYGRMHMALDAHDSYAAGDDDPDRLVPNPAKDHTRAAVRAARARLEREDARADARLVAAATPPPGKSSTIVTSAMETQILAPVVEAENELDAAQDENRDTPARLALKDVRPGQQVLESETKLITHAIRMAAYNIQATLAGAIRTHTSYSHAGNEAHVLIRDALKNTGDIIPDDKVLQVRLDPLPTPRATRALAELCDHLNTTEARFPGTDLVMYYDVKQYD